MKLGAILLGACVLLSAACVVSQVDLIGKRCPCAAPLTCDDATQRCVQQSLDLAAPDAGSVDLALAPSILDNGDYELPTPIIGCDARQAGVGLAGSYGCRVCAVDLVGSEHVSGVEVSSSFVTTGRYRFELWVRAEEPATTLASVAIEVHDGNGTFAGVTPERFSAASSGWQQIVVHLDPGQDPTRVTTATMRLYAKLRVYGGTTMGCAAIDEWYLGPE